MASDLGPVILDGTIRYISPSQMERFDDKTPDGEVSREGCNRKWWLRYKAGLKEKATKSTTLGDKCHLQVEHYLKTGQDCLGDVVRPGLRFLPRPGSDLLVEQKYGTPREYLPGGIHSPIESDVTLFGVPLVLRIDLMHNRGEFVEDSGLVVPTTAPEVLDHKTSKMIADEVDPETGIILKATYTKDAEELAKTWQMTSYGIAALERWRDATHVHLGHAYYQTEGARVAKKRSKLVTAEQIRRRWREGEQLVASMQSCATKVKVEDVAPNFEACGAFGGFQFKLQCPRPASVAVSEALGRFSAARLLKNVKSLFAKSENSCNETSVALKNAAPTTSSEGRMGLLDKYKADSAAATATTTTTPAAPPPAPAVDAAAVAAEKAALLAEEAKAKGSAPPAEPAPTEGGVCKASGIKVELKMKEAVDKKIQCGCGQVVKVKPQEMEDKYYAVIPKHNLVVEKKPEPPAAPTIKVTEVKDDGTREPVLTTSTPAVMATIEETKTTVDAGYKLKGVAADGGFVLCFGTRLDGAPMQRFDVYTAKLCRDLEKQFNAADVQCAPNDSPLSFAKWKGALGAAARETPPGPGMWFVPLTNGVAIEAAEALAPQAAAVWRA